MSSATATRSPSPLFVDVPSSGTAESGLVTVPSVANPGFQKFYQIFTESGVAIRFREASRAWKQAIENESSMSVMFSDPSYLEIIGMGRRAIPFLLSELQNAPDHWFAALYAITRENPVPEAAVGDLAAMSEAWVGWGRENGYV